MSKKNVNMSSTISNKILEGRTILETACPDDVNTASSIVKALKPEILKLRKAGVPLRTISEKLSSVGIKASKQLICMLVPLDKEKVQKGKKALNESSGEVTEKLKTDTAVVQKQEQGQRPTPAPVAAPKSTPKLAVQKPTTQNAGTTPDFKVPDISTLPPELTSIPDFDPAIEKVYEFVDERGVTKNYFRGRIFDAMKKGRQGFDMNKPAALKV